MLDLLRVEVDLLWHIDDRGRIGGPRRLVVAVADDGVQVFVGAEVPERVAERLVSLVRPARRSDEQPYGLSECQELLGGGELSSGPTYLVDRDIAYPVGESVICSTDEDAARVRALSAPTWKPDEWNDLVDGKLGPWAMAVIDDTVASICHTPRQSEVAVEAGTWTDPAFRGQGLAAETTAAWARLISPDVHIFYSTWAENISSQRVAARLGLPCIGWIWKLT